MLAAITNRIHAEAMASLPPNVRRRVRALRSLQKEFVDIEAKFYGEVHALECKYEKLYKPLFEKVRWYRFITGRIDAAVKPAPAH